MEESSGNSGSKISQMLRNAKVSSIDEIDKMKAEKEKLEREKSRLEESITECPTCVTKGHSHALKNVGHGKLRCTGNGCVEEYSLIPNNADYKCVECGIPHKRPIKELEKEDSCPFCGSMEFIEQDYKRIKDKVSKKK